MCSISGDGGSPFLPAAEGDCREGSGRPSQHVPSCSHVAPKGIQAPELHLRSGGNQQAPSARGSSLSYCRTHMSPALGFFRSRLCIPGYPQRFALFSSWRVSLGARAAGNIAAECSSSWLHGFLFPPSAFLGSRFWRVRELRRSPRCCGITRTESFITFLTGVLPRNRHFPKGLRRRRGLCCAREEGPLGGARRLGMARLSAHTGQAASPGLGMPPTPRGSGTVPGRPSSVG